MILKTEKIISKNHKIIGIISPNSEYHYILFLLCSKRNILLVPLDFASTKEIIQKQINFSKIDLILVNKNNFAKNKKLKCKKKLKL